MINCKFVHSPFLTKKELALSRAKIELNEHEGVQLVFRGSGYISEDFFVSLSLSIAKCIDELNFYIFHLPNIMTLNLEKKKKKTFFFLFEVKS